MAEYRPPFDLTISAPETGPPPGNALAALLPPRADSYAEPPTLLNRLAFEYEPDGFGGWRIVPKRWSNPGGAPFYGLMFMRRF